MNRPLTSAERAGLPAGLLAELPGDIVLINRHHPLSILSKWLRGYAVILVRGGRIFWPGLPEDLSRDATYLSILAHELVHVWQYHTGMTLLGYIWRDIIQLFGRYDYRLVPNKLYRDYGYEQQAAMMEDWMRLRQGQPARHGEGVVLSTLGHLLPFIDGDVA